MKKERYFCDLCEKEIEERNFSGEITGPDFADFVKVVTVHFCDECGFKLLPFKQ